MVDTNAHYITSLPQPLQASTAHWFTRLNDENGELSLDDEALARLAKVVACSEFAQTILLRDWSWFLSVQAQLQERPTAMQGFQDRILADADDLAMAKARLRRFRNRFLLQVLWREVVGVADLDETLEDTTALAEGLLHIANQIAAREMLARFGEVRNTDGAKVPLLVIGMGKLGGRELNFSSDIDIIFCYAERGQSDGARALSAQEFFGRQSRLVIALLDEVTADGFCFRVDTRLRPFGESGPPVVSFAALESYLLQHGRDWERYAYVKARLVGCDKTERIRKRLYDGIIRPFVFRRYLDYGVFESLREMQAMIAEEVRQKELSNNVKRGPGGIREIEFIVQALQLVRGGPEPELQIRALQRVLPMLVGNGGLSSGDANLLSGAYRFLRRLENFIQGLRDQQLHELPDDTLDQWRLCVAMGSDDWEHLQHTLGQHRAAVTRVFDVVAFRGTMPDSDIAVPVRRLWSSAADATLWDAYLKPKFADASSDLATCIVQFRKAGTTLAADAVAQERLQRLLPKIVHTLTDSSRPVVALSRTLTVISRILRRSAYLALLNENEAALSRLINLCGRSQLITDEIARFPMLLDELLDPRVFSGSVTKIDLAEELEQRLLIAPLSDVEQRMQVIASFQRATLFRIAIADFQNDLPLMKVSDGLTWLAEVVLDETLRVAWADLTARYGVPTYRIDDTDHEAGFCVVAYGKLGGLELSYGSDLDVVFLHNSRGTEQKTNGGKALDNQQFFGRLVQRLLHFLTTQTNTGALYDIDMRLRPDGKSGLLVSSTDAFARYQEENAWTWEHQALLRARAVAGDPLIAAEFEGIRKDTLVNLVDRERLRDDVISMRSRMRQKLDRSGSDTFDLKHGRGGIGDIEFLVQYLVLKEASAKGTLTHFTDNIRQLDALSQAGILSSDDGQMLQETYKAYRSHLHHRVLDGESALIPASDFVDKRGAVVAIWDRWLG